MSVVREIGAGEGIRTLDPNLPLIQPINHAAAKNYDK